MTQTPVAIPPLADFFVAENIRSYERDGRRIAFQEFGDPDGTAVIFLHGGPGSRLEGALFDGAGKELGVRIIAFDRPGLGASGFVKPVTLQTIADDVAGLADHLELERPAVMGWSGGGVPALACLGLHPERFRLGVSLAGYTRLDREQMRNLIPEPDRTASRYMRGAPFLFRGFFHLTRFIVRRVPGSFLRALIRDAGPADREVYGDPAFAELLIADQQESLRQGVDGICADARLSYEEDWGFAPASIQVPVHVFQGTQDTRVPEAFGHDLAALLPTAKLHLLKGCGHLFPVTHAREVLSVLTDAPPAPGTAGSGSQ